MNKKSFSILIVIIVLIGTMMGGYFFKKSSRESRKAAAPIQKTLNAIIKTKETEYIKINDLVFTHTIEDNEDYWSYADKKRNLVLPVSSSVIEQFLHSVKNFERGRLIEKNPNDLAKYGLASNVSKGTMEENKSSNESEDNPYSITIQAKSEDDIFSFIVSKSTSPTYAQFQNNSEVYQVSSSLNYTLSNDPLYWLDKRLFMMDIDSEKIASVSIQYVNGTTVAFEKSSEKHKKKEKSSLWHVPHSSDIVLDDEKITSYLNTVVNANAKEFSDVVPDQTMKTAQLIIKTKDGSSYGITLYSFADTYYVKNNERDTKYSYLLSDYLRTQLFPNDDDQFRKKEVEGD